MYIDRGDSNHMHVKFSVDMYDTSGFYGSSHVKGRMEYEDYEDCLDRVGEFLFSLSREEQIKALVLVKEWKEGRKGNVWC